MKIIKKANGDQSIKMDKAEWEKIGKIAGWDDSWERDHEEVEPEIGEDVAKMIDDLGVSVKEDKKAIPAEIKKEKRYKKKDPKDWDAEREERKVQDGRDKAQTKKKKYDKFLEKEVYSKPPIQ